MTDLRIDPDCRDGKCTSCIGCEHDCHLRLVHTGSVWLHPSYGSLASVSVVWTEPPQYRVEAGNVGEAAALVGPRVFDLHDLDAAIDYAQQIAGAVMAYKRARLAADKALMSAMRPVPAQTDG